MKILNKDEPFSPILLIGSELKCPECGKEVIAVFKNIFVNIKEIYEGKGRIKCSCGNKIFFVPDFEKYEGYENIIIISEGEN